MVTLDESLSIYGRLRPLASILWHRIRAEVFRSPGIESIHNTQYHRNTVCIRKSVFLLRTGGKLHDESAGELAHTLTADLLCLLKPSEVHAVTVSFTVMEERLKLVKMITTTLIHGLTHAKVGLVRITYLYD